MRARSINAAPRLLRLARAATRAPTIETVANRTVAVLVGGGDLVLAGRRPAPCSFDTHPVWAGLGQRHLREIGGGHLATGRRPGRRSRRAIAPRSPPGMISPPVPSGFETKKVPSSEHSAIG